MAMWGGITYRVPRQVLEYPFSGLEKFLQIHQYLRLLEETIIFIILALSDNGF